MNSGDKRRTDEESRGKLSSAIFAPLGFENASCPLLLMLLFLFFSSAAARLASPNADEEEEEGDEASGFMPRS